MLVGAESIIGAGRRSKLIGRRETAGKSAGLSLRLMIVKCV